MAKFNARTVGFLVGLLVVAAVAGIWYSRANSTPTKDPQLKRVVINEAVRTLLYLPLYHALEQGYFRDEGLDVQIVTGGTATNSFAAMLSGEADFSQADPMYVPISREKGSQTKVVAQVVARIAVWGLTMDPNVKEWTADAVRGKKISTHVRPMTAFTYAEKAVRDLGLDPDKDVQIIQSNPGSELVPLLNGKADFAFTLEPSVSIAVSQGAHIVLSFPKLLGDQIFTGLMTTEQYLHDQRQTVLAIVRAYERSLTAIRQDTSTAVQSAEKYFPSVAQQILTDAIQRIISEQVLPEHVLVSEESWARSTAVRVTAGDLRANSDRASACDVTIMELASN